LFLLLIQVADRVTDMGMLAGKSPITVVASCLYLVSCLSNDPKSARSIAEVAGCVEATLKNAYRILLEDAQELTQGLTLPKKYTDLPL
jgi:transcription initiation factor TFIIB